MRKSRSSGSVGERGGNNPLYPDTKGMSAFQRLHQPFKILLVGPQGIPWQEFLKLNPMELFSQDA
jgi:hypothetical protein